MKILRLNHIIYMAIFILGVSSLILKSATILDSTPLSSATDKKLIDFMSNHGFNYINSWSIINETTYRTTKFKPTLDKVNCDDEILVIGMSGDATLVAMLESGVNRNKETLLYLYNGILYKRYPQYRIWWDSHQKNIKNLYGNATVTPSVLGLFSPTICTQISALPWQVY